MTEEEKLAKRLKPFLRDFFSEILIKTSRYPNLYISLRTQLNKTTKIRLFQATQFEETDLLFPLLKHVKKRFYIKFNTLRVKFTLF